MANEFDVIVIGVGSMGSSTCYQLASRGVSVLGLEQFSIPHDQGSHAGQSRLIRKAYFEHADYVPLLERAYDNWNHLESITGSQVYFPTGLLYAGKPDELLIKGVKHSSEKFNVPIETVTKKEFGNRFPQFEVPDDYEVLFEPDAGFVTPERAVSLYVAQAIKAGATIHSNEETRSWKQNETSIEVVTNKGTYVCKKLVITAGAWTGKMLPELSTRLQVTRQVIAWLNPKIQKQFELRNFPCWLFDDHTQPGMYYGFPILNTDQFGAPAGLKVAHHYPGSPTHANSVNRNISQEEQQILIKSVTKFLPNGYASLSVLKTCLYTNTPDENFIIDFVPESNKNVIMAAGFSGHGFKFVSVVGEIVADLSISGSTKLPIHFLRVSRLFKA
ncbi:MAG: N-methyl-L-tryptophan oxidase [Cyclobacteriaceae bacterium]|nr:N-methyl-L-tryptophan oxidase [Cyclobacteriaceae bacterium]